MSALNRRLVKLESVQPSDGDVTIFSWAEEGEINIVQNGDKDIERRSGETEKDFLARAFTEATVPTEGRTGPIWLWALHNQDQKTNPPKGKPQADVFRIVEDVCSPVREIEIAKPSK